jgi:hypothetical protein
MIFNPLKRIVNENSTQQLVRCAIQNDIAVYAIHTNLDNAIIGVNHTFAQKLGIIKVRILRPMQGRLKKMIVFVPEGYVHVVRTALFKAGAGKIGSFYDCCSFNSNGMGTFRPNQGANPFAGTLHQLHEAQEMKVEIIFSDHIERQIIQSMLSVHPYQEPAYDIIRLENTHSQFGSGMIGELPTKIKIEDFFRQMKENLSLDVIKHSKICRSEVQTIAFCGGSGNFLIQDAIAQKADVFVSSELKHNHFIDYRNCITLADIGHYESEAATKELLCEILNKIFSNFAISQIEGNPVYYL